MGLSLPIEAGSLSDAASRAVAFALGLGFGWSLERAGLGSARKLTGQFYFTDFTVFKVMFSAILTAMLGVFWLGRLGAIDVARIYLPETYLLPQAIGGLIFGVGFVVAGLCPGTSCVAAASGRIDGLATAFGLFAGVMATGFALSYLSDFYSSTARGAFTLPSLLHLPYGIVVAGVTAIALGGFALAERIENREEGSRRGRMMAAAAFSLAALATVAGSPYRMDQSGAQISGSVSLQQDREAEVSPLELATWIKARRDGLRVVDLRTADAFDEYHLPTAVRLRPESLTAAAFAPGQTAVFYGDDDAAAARAAMLIREHSGVTAYSLEGGLAAWIDEVLSPTRGEHQTTEEAAAFARIAEISRYFGGVPQVRSSGARLPASTRRSASSSKPRDSGCGGVFGIDSGRGRACQEARVLSAPAADCAVSEWRDREFGRLRAEHHAYLDYAGSALYGASQVRDHAAFLTERVLGNPHSSHGPSLASAQIIDDARRRVLRFLDADDATHVVCFTANATAAIKLVGESYPFASDTVCVLSADNHDSVNGIRSYARRAGADVRYVPLDSDLRLRDPEPLLATAACPGGGLFAFPAQSNFSGVRHPLYLVDRALRAIEVVAAS